MEGRIDELTTMARHRVRAHTPGRGLAAATLAAICVITAGWWALALYPASADVPDWVLRTRAACFGSMSSGLPSAGGWVLLIGEPIGMAGVLIAVWGDALRADLRWLLARPWGRLAIAATALAMTAGGVASAVRVSRLLHGTSDAAVLFLLDAGATMARLDMPAPPLALIDQSGAVFDLASLRGQPALVTFAFAHCADVCPVVVHELRRARAAAGAEQVPILVATLDPWRDVPSRLPHIASQWALAPHDRVLSGAVDDVNRVLDAWGIGRARNTSTGDISHAATAFVVNAAGRITIRADGGFDRITDALRVK